MSLIAGCGLPSKAGKLYKKRVLTTVLLYLVVLTSATFEVKHGHVHGVWLYPMALAPAALIIMVVVYLGIYLRDETDEYLKMMTMRSVLAGTGALLATIVVSDFLRSLANAGDLQPFICFIIFFATFGVTQGIQQRMNRAAADE